MLTPSRAGIILIPTNQVMPLAHLHGAGPDDLRSGQAEAGRTVVDVQAHIAAAAGIVRAQDHPVVHGIRLDPGRDGEAVFDQPQLVGVGHQDAIPRAVEEGGLVFPARHAADGAGVPAAGGVHGVGRAVLKLLAGRRVVQAQIHRRQDAPEDVGDLLSVESVVVDLEVGQLALEAVNAVREGRRCRIRHRCSGS